MSRKNITYTSALLVLFMIVSYVVDKVVYHMIDQMGEEVYTGQSVGKFNQYLSIKDSLDLIVFGSSRANHHINPSLITEKSYNMGIDGQKIAFSATLLKLLPKNEQIVLFHIDPENVVDDNYQADDLSSLKVMYNKNSIVRKEINRYKKLNSIQRFYWCISYNGILFGVMKNYFKPNYDYTEYNGYDPLSSKALQPSILLNKSKLGDNCEENRDYRLNPIYKSYLADLKKFSKANGKKIIFFTSPRLFDNCKKDNVFLLNEMRRMNFVYHDFSDIFCSTTDLSYWNDATHLSKKGGDRFTRYVKKTIFKPVPSEK
ncbi:SGNH/GDSL hydrolase family protein [Zobellia roscoffensis]|uniref:hypothetical protein n=1 Tax=Zobellia roscoffensis TaxID=2779508 RepID=UPI00188D9FB6|nr:hypothetical protein [Zobellia roscoffensis]